MRRYSLAAVLAASIGLFFFLEFHLWADSYKILNYGSPGRDGYRQIDSCGFDAIMQWRFEQEDYNVNDLVGLDLYPHFGGYDVQWWGGASFYLEADDRDWQGREMTDSLTFFDTSNLSGYDAHDPEAYNEYARRARKPLYNRGYIVANLRTNNWPNAHMCWDYSKWFSTTRISRGPVDSMVYYARFRVKMDENAVDASLLLEVWLHSGIFGNDTVMVAQRQIRRNDFQNPGSYEYFEVSYVKRSHDDEELSDTIDTRTDYRVYWNGEDEVYVDRIDVYDLWAYKCLFTQEYDSACSSWVEGQTNQYVKGFHLVDEPRPWNLNVQKYWHVFIDSLFPEKHVFTSWAKAFNYWLDYYLEDNPAPWHLVNYYVLTSRLTDTLSDTCYYYPAPESCRTLQEAIDTLLNYLDEHREIAQDQGRKLGYNTPLGAWYDRQTGKMALRHPTQWEQEAWIWLPLTHGVDVTSYWDYPSWYHNCTAKPGQCPQDTTAPWMFYDDENNEWVARLRSLAYRDPDGTGGPRDRDWKRYEPHWSVVRRVNRQLHAIGDILADPDSWVAGFTCDEVPQSWVSSFKSDSYTSDKAYVEIATFEHSNIDYLLLVNRRCLSTEGQHVRVGLDLPGDQYYITTLEYFEEGDSAAFTDLTHSRQLNGEIPLSTYLEPGQGKFFKIVPAYR